MFRSFYVDKFKKLLDNSVSTFKVRNKVDNVTDDELKKLKKLLPCTSQLGLKPRKYDSVVKYYEWNQDTEKLEPIEKDMEVEINYYRDSYDYKKFFKQTGEFLHNTSTEMYGDFRVQQNSSLGDFYKDEIEVQKQMDLFEQQQGQGVDELNKEDTPTPEKESVTSDKNTDNVGTDNGTNN